MIKVFAVGTIDGEVKVNNLQNAQSVTFDLRTRKSYVPDNSNKVYEWWRVEIIRKDLSKLLPYLQKGKTIAITDGELRSYSVGTDKDKKYFTVIKINDFQFVNTDNGNSQNMQQMNGGVQMPLPQQNVPTNIIPPQQAPAPQQPYAPQQNPQSAPNNNPNNGYWGYR